MQLAVQMKLLDAEVMALSRLLAVRTLQLEMEYIYRSLEDEALDIGVGSSGEGQGAAGQGPCVGLRWRAQRAAVHGVVMRRSVGCCLLCLPCCIHAGCMLAGHRQDRRSRRHMLCCSQAYSTTRTTR